MDGTNGDYVECWLLLIPHTSRFASQCQQKINKQHEALEHIKLYYDILLSGMTDNV